MKLRGSLLVIVCCLVVESINFSQKKYTLLLADIRSSLYLLAGQGVLFLFYPLLGHLTDVYLTRYGSMKWSFGILSVTVGVFIIYGGIDLTALSI